MNNSIFGRRFWRIQRTVALSVIALWAYAGCGEKSALNKPYYPVKGKVILADGKPLTIGSVLFVGVTTNISVAAPITSDGAFEFTGDKPGLPSGDYRVAIAIDGRQSTQAKSSRSRPKENLPFPTKYLDEDASKLTAVVKADSSSNDFTFTLAN